MRGFAVVTVVLAVGAPAAAQSMGKTFSYDFRKDKGLKEQFKPAGRDGEKFVTQDDKGLKIALPNGGPKRSVAGVVPKWRVRGDFEITLAFEALKSARPTSGSGPRLSIYVKRATERGEALSLERLIRAEDGDVFLAHTAYTDRDGKRKTSSHITKAAATDGRLQLKRTGPTVQFLVAEGPGSNTPFREIYQTDWGTEDLDLVRFGVDSGDSTLAYEVRLTEVFVAASSLPTGPPSRPGISWWLWAGLAAVAVAGVGIWWWRKRSAARTEAAERAEAENAEAKPPEEGAPKEVAPKEAAPKEAAPKPAKQSV